MKNLLACIAVALSVGTAAKAEIGPADTLVDREAAVAAIREGLRDHLMDATSAEIRISSDPGRQEISSLGYTQVGQLVCAKVNAKNAYGAYVGERPYLFVLRDDGQVAVFERQRLRGDDLRTYQAWCGVD